MVVDTPVRGADRTQNIRDIVVQAVCAVMLVVAGLQLFAPLVHPAILALLTLAPWVLLVMVLFGNGAYLLNGPKCHTVVLGTFALPVVLFLGTVLQWHMIDWRGPVSWAVGSAVGFAMLATMADASAQAARPDVVRNVRAGNWLGVLITGALLGWSALTLINAGIPSRPADAHGVTIARKWVSGGKSHTPYFVFANAPDLGITDFVAPSGLFRRSAPGDRVCLVIHTGVLGWRWYDVAERTACGDPVWGLHTG